MTFSSQPTDHGNAPIVALHSSASSSSQWRQLTADFEGRFDVFAFDLPGYGRAPLRAEHSQDDSVFSAVPVIREIEKIGRSVHLLGHSYGGAIAIKIALMRPDLVKSLTVYEPATFHFLKNGSSTDKRLFQQIAQVSKQVSLAVAEQNPSAGMRHFLDFWNGNGFWDQLPAVARRRFSGMISSIKADFTHGFGETWELTDLGALDIPTLVMTGLESPELTQHVAGAVAKALPQARLALLPELGHMAPIFQPEWVNARVFEHVASAERPTLPCRWPRQVAA